MVVPAQNATHTAFVCLIDIVAKQHYRKKHADQTKTK